MKLGNEPKSNEQTNKKREIPPAGMHLGILFRVVDAGWCHNEFKGVKSLKTKIRLDFELWPLNDKNEYVMMENGKPFCVSPGFQGWLTLGKYTDVMNSWRGEENPDVETFLGQPALLNIKYTEGKPKDNITPVYANVTAVNPIMRGMFIPEMANPPLVYSTKEHDPDIFAKLPQWIQDWLGRESETFKKLPMATMAPKHSDAPGPTGYESDYREGPNHYGDPPSHEDLPI